MSYGWLLDGFNSNSAGFSVLDSFTVAASISVNKTYTSDVLKHANSIKLFIVIAEGSSDHTLYSYPTLTTSFDKINGIARVTGNGGSYPFFVMVFIQ